MMSNMKAVLLLDRRETLSPDTFVELALWRRPRPMRGSKHAYKSRLAYVVDGACVVRFDNEVGRGDHKHIGAKEARIAFSSVERLLADFSNEITRWNDENRNA
jgi:hypothetical protein